MTGNTHTGPVAPGKGLLKVISILGLVSCGIGCLILMVIVMIGEEIDIGLSTPYLLWILADCCYDVYISVMGLVHCAELEKASFLKRLGIIALVLVFIGAIVDVCHGISTLAVLTMLPISLAFVVLYIAGASKNQKAFETQMSSVS